MPRTRKAHHRDTHRDGITLRHLPSGSVQARVWDPGLRKYRAITRKTEDEANTAAEELRARFVLGTDNAERCQLDNIWNTYCHERYGITASQVQELRDAPSAEDAAIAMRPRPRANWRTMLAMAAVVDGLRKAKAVDFKNRGFRAALARYFAKLELSRSRAADGRVAVSTRRRMLGQIRALTNFARDAGWLPTDPLASFQAAGTGEQEDTNREVFTLTEARALVALDRITDPVWIHAIICLYTGQRDTEAKTVSWTDYEADRRLMWVRKGKGNKRRAISVQTELRDILARVSDAIGPTAKHPCLPSSPIARPTAGRGLLTFSLYVKLLADAGIKRDRGTDPISGMERRLTRHSLRHTYCAAMLASGEPGDNLRIMMGHSEEDLTAHYGAQMATYRAEVEAEGWGRGELRFLPRVKPMKAKLQ